jgi:hypothetical protein
MTIAPQTPEFTAFSSTLTVDYTVCGWVFGSITKFDMTGWTAQSFSADGVLGAFSIGSALVFAPATAAFTSWDSTGSVSIAGVAFDAEFLLEDDGAGWTFGASSAMGDCDFGATAYFNMDAAGNLIQTDYCFCFSSIDFDISFPFACIDLVDMTIGFSAANGFDGVTFSVSGIAVPALPWLTLDLDLTFETGADGKEMILTPVIDLGDFVCIVLYYEYQGHVGDSGCGVPKPAKFDGIYFYGIGLDYSWNGVDFSSLSMFDVNYYDLVHASELYWEVFTISSAADSCCGGGFDFDVSTYFACDSELLFDWGMTEIEVTIGMGSNFDVTFGLVVDVDGFTELSFCFDVSW